MADLISLSGHKIHGPEGVGALYIKKDTPIRKTVTGGHQERGLRAGTENMPGIVGFGKAASLKPDLDKMYQLRDRLIDGLLTIPESSLNGSKEFRLPNNVNIAFSRIEGEGMLLMLDDLGIACSTGSACTSRSLKASHVLIAIGLDVADAHGSLRFTLSNYTTEKDIDYTIESVRKVVDKLRGMTPV
jgi:cysteine desulfurase